MTTSAPHVDRNKVVRQALRAMVIIRAGRWTMADLAGELGVNWRTAYRIVAGLRAAGMIPVEASEERDGREKPTYYRVPAAGLRRVLSL